MKHAITILPALLGAFATQHAIAAEPIPRIQVSELKPLLLRAIDHGMAHGLLVGAGADYLRRRFDASAPVEIDVRTLNTLPQPGCARLEVTTQQRDVLEQGQRGAKAFTYQLSFCRDRRIPERRP